MSGGARPMADVFAYRRSRRIAGFMRRCRVAASALLFPATLAAQAGDSVSLRFAWRDGLTADVEHEVLRVRTSHQGSDTTTMRTRSLMRVAAHPQGFVVRSDSLRVEGFDAAASVPTEFAQRMMSTLGSLTPSFVVSADGEFVQVTDLARLKAAMDSLFAPMVREMGESVPQVASFMGQLLSEQALTASAAQEWNALVGTWVGAEWELGAVYELETEEAVPIMPGLTVPMRLQFSAAGRVPCSEADQATSCVELQMISVPDSAGMKRLTQQLLERLAGVPDAEEVVAALENMEVEQELTVVAEPNTLVPHLVVREKRVRVTVAALAGEDGGTMRQVDRNVQRYRYRK